MPTQNDISDELTDAPLVIRLNRTVTKHYEVGQVDFVEVIRSCMALATAYQRELEQLSPTHAGMIAENAKAICDWMAANKH